MEAMSSLGWRSTLPPPFTNAATGTLRRTPSMATTVTVAPSTTSTGIKSLASWPVTCTGGEMG